MRSIIFIFYAIAILLYIISHDINIIIIVILAILLFHTIYLDIINDELEEIKEALKREGFIQEEEE